MIYRLYTAICFTLVTIFGLASFAIAENEFSIQPTPSYQNAVQDALATIQNDERVRQGIKSDAALKAYYIQVLNQLRHVSLSFSIRDNTYTHDYVLRGPYPKEPTELALKRAEEFIKVVHSGSVHVKRIQVPATRMQQLMKEQKDWVKKITTNPLDSYTEMHQRLQTLGVNASFPELGSIVEYLKLHLQSDENIIRLVNSNSIVGNYWHIAIEYLDHVSSAQFPYLRTVESIQRALEFLDVFHRAHDPTRSPKLYHSDRYDYYGHFLKASVPHHIMIPTIVSLGATDILKARGVPIGFIGVNTDITWVDGFYQTPYEFWVHDINHSRRMWQFFKETAEKKGLSAIEFAKISDLLVREKLIPLIAINKNEDDVTKNRKRLLKVLLFEILHEDALAADVEVILNAVLRPPNLITPFEEMNGNEVTYVMEPGATTLAYAYRKLAHDFYDMPGARIDNVVAEKFRTREGIVEVALRLGASLGADLRREVLEYYVSTDLGFPKDFKSTLEKDIKARPGQTVPLDQVKPTNLDVIALVADLFHQKWQTTTSYFERWKVAQTAFKDGEGINDGKFVNDESGRRAYLKDQNIPENFHQYFVLRPDPISGQMRLYEDIQHIPHRYLTPNNQYENIEGAKVALRLVRRIIERKIQFRNVGQAMAWLTAAAQKQNVEWLRRNRHWALGDPKYDQHWQNLGANLKYNNLNFFKIALDTELGIDSSSIENSQQTLLQEALRRMFAEISIQAKIETQKAFAGEQIHAAWQKRSGYVTRFKRTNAKLDNGHTINSEATLQQYLLERSIPAELRPHFMLVQNGSEVELHEDLQNLSNKYLAPNHQIENELAAELSLDIVERLWSRHLTFKNVESAERWLKSAAQRVHLGVLRRDTNDSVKNPAYNVHWLDLPAINQSHDLASVQAALVARFKFNPASMSQAQKNLLLDGIANLERKIAKGGVRRSCIDLLGTED